MFSAQPRNPKTFAPKRQPGTQALSLLMKALESVGEGGAGISRAAGTLTAEDRLAAMTPEERAGTNVMDQLQGLALTDQFRKRLKGQEADAATAEAVGKKNIFTTERDKALSDLRKSEATHRAGLKPATGTGKGKDEIISDKDTEISISELDKVITHNQTAIAANDTQDGVGLADKSNIVQQSQKRKYELLKKLGYKDVTARGMAFKDSPLTVALHKRISGNVYKDKK